MYFLAAHVNRLLARSLTDFLTEKFSLFPWLQSLSVPVTRTHSEIVVPAAFVNCVLVVLLVCFAPHTFYHVLVCACILLPRLFWYAVR